MKPQLPSNVLSTMADAALVELVRLEVGRFVTIDHEDRFEHLNALTPEWRSITLGLSFDDEVRNGGFAQYFFNSWAEFADETVDALNDAGMPERAALLMKAIDKLFAYAGHTLDLAALLKSGDKQKYEDYISLFYDVVAGLRASDDPLDEQAVLARYQAFEKAAKFGSLNKAYLALSTEASNQALAAFVREHRKALGE